MSAKGLSWVRTQHPRNSAGKLDPDAKLVLYALVDMDNEKHSDHRVFPSQSTLRQRTSLSVSTIGKKLKLLEEQGYLSRERRCHSGGPRKGQRTSDMIYLNLNKPPDPKIESQEQPEALKAANRRRTSQERAEQKATQEASEHDRRVQWERTLGPDWQPGSIPSDAGKRGWGKSLAVEDDLVVCVPNKGTFTNANRPNERRRPVQMWTAANVLHEAVDILKWVNDDCGSIHQFVESASWEWASRTKYDPAREVAAVHSLFKDREFIDLVKRDNLVAGHMVLHAIQQQSVSGARH